MDCSLTFGKHRDVDVRAPPCVRGWEESSVCEADPPPPPGVGVAKLETACPWELPGQGGQQEGPLFLGRKLYRVVTLVLTNTECTTDMVTTSTNKTKKGASCF